MMLDKIVGLQTTLASQSEKVDFLENHIAQLVEDIGRKNRHVQCSMYKFTYSLQCVILFMSTVVFSSMCDVLVMSNVILWFVRIIQMYLLSQDSGTMSSEKSDQLKVCT